MGESLRSFCEGAVLKAGCRDCPASVVFAAVTCVLCVRILYKWVEDAMCGRCLLTMFSQDTLPHMLSRLSLPELHEWAQSSPENYMLVRQELRGRHGRMLSRFLCHPERFMAMLRARESVISGSFALNYLVGDRGWSCSDLDVYVPYEEFANVCSYMRCVEGYSDLDDSRMDVEEAKGGLGAGDGECEVRGCVLSLTVVR